MTRSISPVYIYYPPDRSGRRPSLRTELQYASPNDREIGRDYTTSQHTATTPQQPLQYQQQSQSDQPAHPSRPATRRTSFSSGVQEPLNNGLGNHQTRRGNSPFPGEHAPERRHPKWICCNPKCGNPGPYLDALYSECLHGCGTKRCENCTAI